MRGGMVTGMFARWRVFLVMLLTLGGVAQGQPVADPAPLMGGVLPPEGDGAIIEQEGAARRAQELGFTSVAVSLWQELVASSANAAERDERLLQLAMAFLELGDAEAAREVWNELSDQTSAAARLRRGLMQANLDQLDAARQTLAGLSREDIAPNELPWYHYLAGALADAVGDVREAREQFAAAMRTSASSLQRARFELADLQSQWRETEPTEAQLAQLSRRMEEFAGERVGFDAAKRYAAVLASLGRGDEAVAFLQNQLLSLPPAERELRDDLRLLLGVIAGPESGIGRNALRQLLDTGVNRAKQRMALRMLAQSATNPATEAELRDQLNRLLAGAERHPIEQDLILFRAQLAEDTDDATRDALDLLERFPASDLRTAALGILLSAAWEDGRYRAAAGYAAQARREMAERDTAIRAELGVLQAEAFFRGGDYRSAADAYAAAFEEPVAGVEPGEIVFQEVLARVRDGQLTAAANRIDLLADDDRFTTENRWQAEYNLARELQARGRVTEAYARINRVMGEQQAEANLAPELAVRMAWLQARLALAAGEPQRTLELVPTLIAQLEAVPPELAVEVASSLRLVEAEANFDLGEREAALGVLQGLRADYPDSDAAVYSYIAEATEEAAEGQLVKAQQLLAELILQYPENRYAPLALFQSALLAESRREESFLREANTKIEQLVRDYPNHELVFYARFKQGDLLRKMGLWEPARLVYEELIRNFPQHQEVWAVQMALADSLAAQASTDVSLQDSAAAIYERLRDVANAPTELRIEAGFKEGNSLARRGQADRAADIWWQVVDEFLVQNEAVVDLGTRGRYWLARILAQLGELLEQEEKLDEARRAYAMIRQWGLPEAEWAEAQLRRLGEPVPLAAANTPGVDE